MQWSALVCLTIVIVCGVTVKSVLAFTFCAIVSFILARNLLRSDVELDFTRVFIYKGQSPNKLRNASSVINKPFPQALAECRETAIKNILRDFVVSWFQNVGVEERFVVETRMLLEEATESLYEEVVRTDVSTFVEKLCIVLHKHLAAYRVAKLSLAKNHEKFKFNAVKFSEVYQSLEEKPRVHSNNELQYLRTVADLLLHRLVKKSALDCDTGRFILREIFAINLFLPLVDSLSDPDFLNVSIINVLGDEGQEFQNTAQSESNNISEQITKPSSMLMECPREKTSDCDPCSNSCFTGDSLDTELSTECKLQNMAVVNPNHEEFIEVSTEQSGNSKKTGNIEPTKSSKQDCASNHFEVKSKTNSQAPVESNERYDAFNRESTNSSSLTRNINTATVRDELKNENGKNPEGKENGLKLKALRGFRIHPNGFKFSRNLKHFNKSPAVKQSVLGKMSQSISETFSSKGSPKVNQDQGDQPTLDDTMNNLDLADTNLPLQGNEEVNQTGMHENPATNEDIQDPVHSELGMCKINSSSSFEEVEVGNIIDCNKDNVTVTEPESKENDNDGTLTCMTTSNQTNGTSKQRQKIVSESSNEDESFVARRINYSLEKEVSGSSSSSTEEWDTDVLVHVQDNRFVAEDGDISDVETGKEVFSATGESDIHVAQKPCLMISIPSTELVKDHTWEPGKRKYTVYHIVVSFV